MHGVSEVIAIILILMITISLAGLAYMFMSTTMADVTSSAGSTVDTTTSSMLTTFTIESMDVAKVYVRNTGQNALTSLSVYVNNEPATYNVTTPIAAGAVGTITIYSFIPDGATVKVTSPNGFSTSKVAQPCERAVGCWKLDEGSGNKAYDYLGLSTATFGDGTCTPGTGNCPSWTTGKYGNAISLDGSNDFLIGTSPWNFSSSVQGAYSFWFKVNNMPSVNALLFQPGADRLDTNIEQTSGALFVWFYDSSLNNHLVYHSSISYVDSNWHYLVVSKNSTAISVYIDAVYVGGFNTVLPTSYTQNQWYVAPYNSCQSLIDEIRIYSHALY
jgi:flagellin-like protein